MTKLLLLSLLVAAPQNVVDHGADPASDDNTAAFQAAWVAAQGDVVTVPPGTFKLKMSSWTGNTLFYGYASGATLHVDGRVEIDADGAPGYLILTFHPTTVRIEGPGEVELVGGSIGTISAAVVVDTGSTEFPGGQIGGRIEFGSGVTVKGFERATDGRALDLVIEEDATVEALDRAVSIGYSDTIPTSVTVEAGARVVGTISVGRSNDLRILGTSEKPVRGAGPSGHYWVYDYYSYGTFQSQPREVRHVVLEDTGAYYTGFFIRRTLNARDIDSSAPKLLVSHGRSNLLRVRHRGSGSEASVISAGASSDVRTVACDIEHEVFPDAIHIVGAGRYQDVGSRIVGPTYGLRTDGTGAARIALHGTYLEASYAGMQAGSMSSAWIDGVTSTSRIRAYGVLLDARRSSASAWVPSVGVLRGGELTGYIYDVAHDSGGFYGTSPAPEGGVVLDRVPPSVRMESSP